MSKISLQSVPGRLVGPASAPYSQPRPYGTETILEISGFCVDFPRAAGAKKVLDGVSLSLRPGEILGLVGASGSGKSLLAKCLLRLEKPARIISGSCRLQGREITRMTPKQMMPLRGRLIGYVPQNPLNALDPVYSLGFQFREVLAANGAKGLGRASFLSKVLHWMKMVDISEAAARLGQYPHQWSIGMLQRALLAMSFSASPQVIILDEVTSALDPTITLQIISVILNLRDRNRTAILFITHDLAVASQVCDSIAVLHQGRIVEQGATQQVFDNPSHPYTKQLASSLVL